jgi:tetratricopeptide (TPR) repeat protein
MLRVRTAALLLVASMVAVSLMAINPLVSWEDPLIKEPLALYEAGCFHEALVACDSALACSALDTREHLLESATLHELRAELLELSDAPVSSLPDYHAEIDILNVVGGTDQSGLANAVYQEAARLMTLHRPAEAIPVYLLCRRMIQQPQGPTFPEISDLDLDLARCHRALGLRQEAESFYKAKIAEDELSCHSSRDLTLEELAQYFQENLDYHNAKTYYRLAIKAEKEERPISIMNIALLEMRVADRLMEMKDYVAVPSLLADAQQIATAASKDPLYGDSADLGYVHFQWALYFNETGRQREAVQALETANRCFATSRTSHRRPYTLSDLTIDPAIPPYE